MNDIIVPYVRRAWYAVLEPNHYIKDRVLFDYEILYIKEGQAKIRIENKLYLGDIGDIFIFRPRQQHSILVTATSSLIQPHVHFDLLYRENRSTIPVSYKDIVDMNEDELNQFHPDILDRFISPFPSVLHLHNPKYVELLLFEVIHEFENPGAFNEIKLTRLFLRLWEQILHEVHYNFTDAKRDNADHAQRIKLYIDENISRPLSMEDLSTLTHFSKSYIFRIFHNTYNIAPLQYHTLLRVQRAKAMIHNTNMSITEISERLGFSSIQSFCRVFKKLDGYSPTTYRQKK